MSRQPRLIVCPDCGRLVPHHAKGRCAGCYPRTRDRLIDCPGCGRRRPHHRGGRCARCDRLAHTVVADCAACGQHRRVRAGVCSRCKTLARARPGACSRCRRRVPRLWSGRCAFCAKTSQATGSCSDCLCWAASITAGRCRACRDFATRNQPGCCRSCRRQLPVNRARRCRLCVAARREAHRSGAGARGEPGERPGIQLLFGDMPAFGRVRRRTESGLLSPPTEMDGQLELFRVRIEPARAAVAAQAWTRSPAGTELTGQLRRFGAAHGWPAATVANTVRALALLAAVDPTLHLDDDIVAELRRRHLPPTRLRQFLLGAGLAEPPASPTLPAALTQATAGLPAAMAGEVSSWTDALAGHAGRGRPHDEHTIASYLRAVSPALHAWAARHHSLREVTADDIADVVAPLTGSARTLTTVALRSLFATLKANRMIFADPARRTRPGRFPRRPPLGLDHQTRAGLLPTLTRPDHRLTLLLAGVHALSRADIAALTLNDVDLAHGRLTVRGRRRVLDEPTRRALTGWLDQRRRRWPTTANPHLLITYKSACGLQPVSDGYFKALTRTTGIPISTLRADRLLAEAHDTGGDPLTLVDLFGLSADTAIRYCTGIDDTTTARPAGHGPGPRRAGARR